MERRCPICEGQALEHRQAVDLALDVCPRCGGIWFDKGELEAFPDRPTVRQLMPLARHAPGRCRKKAHAVPRSLTACSQCGSAAALCPVCQSRLAMVSTPRCAVDVCLRCEGVWLDQGELQLLENAAPLPPMPSTAQAPGSLQGWEIPAATDDPRLDPYRAPGQLHALDGGPTRVVGLICHHCDAQVSGEDAFAFDGDLYCAGCRPDGAVRGSDAQGPLDRWMDWLQARASSKRK